MLAWFVKFELEGFLIEIAGLIGEHILAGTNAYSRPSARKSNTLTFALIRCNQFHSGFEDCHLDGDDGADPRIDFTALEPRHRVERDDGPVG